ncbi:MAG: c-type cytochrome [Terracidiphilus sp.]
MDSSGKLAGAAVFQAKCARCHNPTSTKALHGPGLQAITKVKAMPSGAPPTDEETYGYDSRRARNDARLTGKR